MSTPPMNTAARHAFAPPHVRQRIESAPTRGAAPVHVVARAGENRARDYGAHRLAPLRGGLGVDTSPPAGFAAGGPPFSSVNSWPVNRLPLSGFPRAALVFTRQLVCLLGVTASRRFGIADRKERFRMRGEADRGLGAALTAAEISRPRRPMRRGSSARLPSLGHAVAGMSVALAATQIS